jgi:hypothetical protein
MSDDDLVIQKINPDDPVELEKKIRPLFKGYTQATQGACLAQLTALFIACHQVKGDKKATALTRQGLLQFHMKMVWDMVPEAERQLSISLAKEHGPRLQ